MIQKRILIVDDDNDLREELKPILKNFGYKVRLFHNREAAQLRQGLNVFDLIITDLTESTESGKQLINEIQFYRSNPSIQLSSVAAVDSINIIKAFKIDASNFKRNPYNSEELRAIVEKTLSYKAQIIDAVSAVSQIHEKIEFAFPSDISLMHSILNYLVERVAKLGVINVEQSNLFIALDEAFVNAVKHGNRYNTNKTVHIIADLSPREARFTVQDEGEGFNPKEIPDPCDPKNLFKTSGRGVLLIHNIMDEVQYNERGNRLTMVKRPDAAETRRRADDAQT